MAQLHILVVVDSETGDMHVGDLQEMPVDSDQSVWDDPDWRRPTQAEQDAAIAAETLLTTLIQQPEQRLDTYVLIEAAGETVEQHMWATPSEAETLKAKAIELLRAAGYAQGDYVVTFESGGDYYWIVEDDTDLDALAGEMVAGWVMP